MITDDHAPDVPEHAPEPERADPRRWVTLAILLTAVLIAALDSTVLNVAIPTILREFRTTLPSLQWVITGYSLTFAALLIIGGRLGDIFGARRMFVIGAALFGVGSLIASLSTGVVTLVVGEAVIEGIGASLMLPATMGILSSTFVGRERGTAFGAWGATLGAAVAFGPLLGGFLTTHYSWRWAFRINVIVVPFAILGAMLFMPRVAPKGERQRIDVRGAALIATGMFALVFGISEGGTYGWWRPLQSLDIGGVGLWPSSRPVSIVPIAFVVSALLLWAFLRTERALERADAGPLFEFGQLRFPAFRWGLATLVFLAMGQISFLFILSVFLQDSLHLSAVDTGLWLVPSGVFIVAGSQLGARLTRRIDTTRVVQIGLLLEAVGLGAVALAVTPSITYARLLPGFALFGVGIGFAGSQLTNVVLADIEPHKAGAASGANTTVRMIGSSLGIAVISSLLSLETTRRAVDLLGSTPGLSPAVRARAIAAVRGSGVNFAPHAGTPAGEVKVLRHVLDTAVASAARPPLLYGTAVVTVGTLVSLLIPLIGGADRGETPEQVEVAVESELLADSVAVQ
ncbi:MAG: MFS transporter [Acidimicrobiales bacterium]